MNSDLLITTAFCLLFPSFFDREGARLNEGKRRKMKEVTAGTWGQRELGWRGRV